jgi:hypothetical protein
VYAILAFACHFAREPVASQQGYFIAKARLGLGDASGRSAKPRDYILAGSILARAVSWGGDASAASRLSRGRIAFCPSALLEFCLPANALMYQTPFIRLCD